MCGLRLRASLPLSLPLPDASHRGNAGQRSLALGAIDYNVTVAEWVCT